MATRSSRRTTAAYKTSGLAALVQHDGEVGGALWVRLGEDQLQALLLGQLAGPLGPRLPANNVLIDHSQGLEPMASRQIKHPLWEAFCRREQHDEVPPALLPE